MDNQETHFSMHGANSDRLRAAELGIRIGRFASGTWNAITDVPGVRVGHTTLIAGEGPLVVGQGPIRTGVTVIWPRIENPVLDPVFAGWHILNGNGEMTGLAWITETGMLATPIALTNTCSLGIVRDAMIAYDMANGGSNHPDHAWNLPVVAETWDGFLSDIGGMHVQREHVFSALDTASSGPVLEGCVGGGTGMICHGFKGGIGTASRCVPTPPGDWIVGVLVQANHGQRHLLRVAGVPVGQSISATSVPLPQEPILPGTSSIIGIAATNAPLLPIQCRRLAQRLTLGVARTGGLGEASSGDFFLAFSTANRALNPWQQDQLCGNVVMLPDPLLSGLFEAVAEACEEAIINALCAATTMVGINGRTAYALPPEHLVAVMRHFNHIAR